jgi:hypothetical protein
MNEGGDAVLDISDGLLDVHLGEELVLPPIEQREVALLASHQKVGAFSRVVDLVRSERLQVQVEPLRATKRGERS